mmetsp:Transcript_880/g.954  ORF Transcript_880/g.954 Transcript_880/m.954 type:complete len:272 (+) Transcript_880:569-1384(+)
MFSGLDFKIEPMREAGVFNICGVAALSRRSYITILSISSALRPHFRSPRCKSSSLSSFTPKFCNDSRVRASLRRLRPVISLDTSLGFGYGDIKPLKNCSEPNPPGVQLSKLASETLTGDTKGQTFSFCFKESNVSVSSAVTLCSFFDTLRITLFSFCLRFFPRFFESIFVVTCSTLSSVCSLGLLSPWGCSIEVDASSTFFPRPCRPFFANCACFTANTFKRCLSNRVGVLGKKLLFGISSTDLIVKLQQLAKSFLHESNANNSLLTRGFP